MGDWVIDTLKDPRIAKLGVDASIARAPGVRRALLCPHSNSTRIVTSVVTRVYHCNELQGRYKVVTIELKVVMVNSLQGCNEFL